VVECVCGVITIVVFEEHKVLNLIESMLVGPNSQRVFRGLVHIRNAPPPETLLEALDAHTPPSTQTRTHTQEDPWAHATHTCNTRD